VHYSGSSNPRLQNNLLLCADASPALSIAIIGLRSPLHLAASALASRRLASTLETDRVRDPFPSNNHLSLRFGAIRAGIRDRRLLALIYLLLIKPSPPAVVEERLGAVTGD